MSVVCRTGSFVEEAIMEKPFSKRCVDDLHSVASLSTRTGLSSGCAVSTCAVASRQSKLCAVHNANRFSDLLEDFRDSNADSDTHALRPIVDDCFRSTVNDDFLVPKAFSDIVFTLNQEDGPFRSFPMAVLIAAAPKKPGGAAPIVFCSAAFEAPWNQLGHALHKITTGQCLFDLCTASGKYDAKSLRMFQEAAADTAYDTATVPKALEVQAATHNIALSEPRTLRMKNMKVVELDDESFIVAMHGFPEDKGHGFERLDALMSQHFFYGAPMERQLLDRR